MVYGVQFAFNTLSRVSPVSHGVANVVKRVVIIGTSVVFFGTTLTPKTKAGELGCIGLEHALHSLLQA